MDECNDFDGADDGAGFLYRTMLDRDPNKRRVKPVQPHLLQLDFAGLDDSSDDSDFQIPNGNGSDDDDDDDASSKEKSSIESGSGVESLSEEEHMGTAGKMEGEGMSMGELIQQAKMQSLFEQTAPSEDTGVSSVSSRKVKVLICCVCLGDISEEEDEIVECDGCSISVHEGCYGISESQSVASTASSASTAPWFCDACKAGVTPHCELCPNSGGIYKETDASRWVHLVCALYIPGIAFGDVDKLSPVTLFEMPYSRWGAKECCLCEDSRFSQTGVCIRCDAGMCRTFFHVTCAQREGLLSQASPDEDIADPFYAYCKQHVDKNGVRLKRRNWLALQSNSRQQAPESADQTENLRVQRKLHRHRQKYAAARVKRPPQWVPTLKWPRMLTSSASAVRRLMRKAELLGVNSQMSGASARDLRKKSYVAAAMSVEFVSYYLNRNLKVKNMKSHLQELIAQREKLVAQERVLRVKYDQLSVDVSDLKEVPQQLQKQGQELWHILNSLTDKPLQIPQIWQSPTTATSKTDKQSGTKSDSTLIHKCEMCGTTHDQHCLACCDSCQLYYHLACLNPPLTRMPKKTKLMGWQCSRCVKIDNDAIGSDNEVNPNAPMRLREKIKEPAKFTPSGLREKRKRDMCIITKAKRRLAGKPETAEEDASSPVVIVEEENEEMPTLKREQPFSALKQETVDSGVVCTVCEAPGIKTNTIRCDECGQCYHLTCLDPPLKKSPKLRGYAWLCTACSMGKDDKDTNPGKSPEDDGTNGDTGRKPRRRRNSPSVYGTVPSASPGGRGSRRDAGQAAGSNRHRWNRRRLLQKSPPTLESHMLVNPEVGGLGGGIGGSRKECGVTKSGRSKTGLGSRTGAEGLHLRKRVNNGGEGGEATHEFDGVNLNHKGGSTGVTPLGGAENRSGYEAEEGISECYKDKQHQSESSSGGHAKTSAFAGRGTHEPSESSAAKVGIDAKKADADVGRKKECTKVGSTEATSDKRPGVGHAESATTDGVCVERKVETPAEKTRAKRLKNLGEIVAKLRTENEKAQQHDTNDSN